jgi:hypothetical protein
VHPPNGPRISCGDFLTAHYLTFLKPEAPASCTRLLGSMATEPLPVAPVRWPSFVNDSPIIRQSHDALNRWYFTTGNTARRSGGSEIEAQGELSSLHHCREDRLTLQTTGEPSRIIGHRLPHYVSSHCRGLHGSTEKVDVDQRLTRSPSCLVDHIGDHNYVRPRSG